MKKALSLVLAAALAAGALSGCGSGAQSNTSGNNGGGEQGKTAESNGSSSGGAAQADVGGGTTSDGKYDLVFWVYSDAVLNDQGKLLNQWVKEYCEENPKVNSIILVGKNDADLLTGLMAGVGLPEIVVMKKGTKQSAVG